MNETIRSRLRYIAAKEFPGCVVEFDDDDVFRIVQRGEILSKYPSLILFSDFGDLNDDELRLVVVGTCAPWEDRCSAAEA